MEQLLKLNAITIFKEITGTNHSPLHLLADNYEEYFVKSTQGKLPGTYLINEFLCHFLLREWDFQTPDVAVITVDPDLIRPEFSTKHKKSYYKNICFGSKKLPDALEFNQFYSSPNKTEIKKIKNIQDFLKLGLFDIWIENDDRKPTNFNILLKPESGRYLLTPIDNASVFSTLNHNDLNPSFVSCSFNDSVLYTPLAAVLHKEIKDKRGWCREMEKKFYFWIENCNQNYNEIISCLPKELGLSNEISNKIKDFLFNENRNKLVFSNFISRFKKK